MSIFAQALDAAIAGFPITVGIWIAATITGLALGFLVGVARGLAPVAFTWPLAILVEVLRGTPFLIQAFLLYFGGPFIGIDLKPLVAGWVALSLYSAAYYSEVFRGGIATVPRGHVEAGRLLGLNTRQSVLFILLPEMALSVLPSLVNLAIITIKETAILSTITVPELTFKLTGVGSATFAFAEVTLVLALTYWMLVEATSMLGRAAERWVARVTGA